MGVMDFNTNLHHYQLLGHVVFGSSPRDIYLFLPVIIRLTSDNLDIISARGEYLRAYPPAAQQLCMIYALRHMFYGLNRYFQ